MVWDYTYSYVRPKHIKNTQIQTQTHKLMCMKGGKIIPIILLIVSTYLWPSLWFLVNLWPLVHQQHWGVGAGRTSWALCRQINVFSISITQVQQKYFQLTFTIHPSIHLLNHGCLLRNNFCAEHLTKLCYAAQGKITAAQILNVCHRCGNELSIADI